MKLFKPEQIQILETAEKSNATKKQKADGKELVVTLKKFVETRWYGGFNPSYKDDKREFMKWMKKQPKYTGSKEKLSKSNQSNYRLVHPEPILKKNVTLKPGDILTSPLHAFIFVKWVDDKVETLKKPGFKSIYCRLARIADSSQMWASNIWDSRKTGSHKDTFLKEGTLFGGHGWAHLTMCYAKDEKTSTGKFYFHHSKKPNEISEKHLQKSSEFRAVTVGYLK